MSTNIGVVVIGRNERPRLDQCLASIPRGYPIVYADSASTDNSVAYAEARGVTVVQLKTDRQLTAARGRNAGAEELLRLQPNLDFIQFVDGDCEFEDGWLEKAAQFLQSNPAVAVVSGRRREAHPDASLYNTLCDFEWNTDIGEANASGGDSMVRAVAFVESGGFRDDQLAHEEPEFCARLRGRGWKIWRIDQPMTVHDAAIFRLSQFFRRSRRAGMGMCQSLMRSEQPKDPAALQILSRATFWALILPIAALIGFLISPFFGFVVLAVYLLQWLRQSWKARQSGFVMKDALVVGALTIVSKFAELQGAFSYLFKKKRANVRTDLSY